MEGLLTPFRCLRVGIFILLGLGTLSAQAARLQQPPKAAALTADQLFQMEKAWPVHLSFSREQWDTLKPVPQPAGSTARGFGFIGPEGKRNGISATRGLDFEYVHASLDFDTVHFGDVAVRFKGNGTYMPGQEYGKPSLKVDLNKFVKGQKIGGQETINLHSNIIDGSMMNEELAYRLYRDAGVPASRTTYARVSITVPGLYNRQYFGVYGVVENVDENFVESRFKVADGAIFKPVTTAPFTDVGSTWSAYNQMYDPKDDPSDADKARIIELCQLVSHATDQEFNARIGEYIDLDAFAKYMAVVVWFGNPDSVLQQGQNYYVHLHPKTRKLAFIPWDQDHSWGQFVPFRTPQSQQQLNILRPWTASLMGGGPNRFLERIFPIDAFQKRYLAEMQTLTRTVAQPERLIKQLEELAAFVAPIAAQEPNAVRVARFKQALGESAFTRPNNDAVTVIPIKVFVRARHASVVGQLQKLGME